MSAVPIRTPCCSRMGGSCMRSRRRPQRMLRGGIVLALTALAGRPEISCAVDGVVIGTTHFVNAVLQRRDLTRVAAVRIGLPASGSLPPFCDWPSDLAELVRSEVFMLQGGDEYDGQPIVPFDGAGMRQAARQIRRGGARSVAVAAIFSPLDPSCEEPARAIFWRSARTSR